jgi:hypothetical protein
MTERDEVTGEDWIELCRNKLNEVNKIHGFDPVLKAQLDQDFEDLVSRWGDHEIRRSIVKAKSQKLVFALQHILNSEETK